MVWFFIFLSASANRMIVRTAGSLAANEGASSSEVSREYLTAAIVSTSETFLSPETVDLKMVSVSAEDYEDWVYLTEGYVPDLERQETAYPRTSPLFREFRPQFESAGQSAAWVISARARQCAHRCARWYGGVDIIFAF
jgi:hypothetical protein